MNPSLYVILGAEAASPNPYPILITGVAFNVIVVLVSAWRGRVHAESLHREALTAQAEEAKKKAQHDLAAQATALATKARDDLAAERREAQLKRHEVFTEAITALDSLAYTYTARPHDKPVRATMGRGYNLADTDAVTGVLDKPLADLSEKAGAALANIRLASPRSMYLEAREVYVAAVQTAYYAEWVGRTWSSFPDVDLEPDPEGDVETVDAPEVAENRKRYQTSRREFRAASEKYVDAVQAALWGRA
ncbi:hypothetical protein M8Z33_07510 [Streptomyces sp. ZAF1911]|uniref:hypothetical protein n=1 Tax=Streptomyces sp. ZAF1911 TaxID=2944129 RepID=UPI00237B3576|nr:hypothetical protein [Streptomyces sp. ZAF1911]MDD9376521.1 hypothetical protein [Streptomyces sp. ZAF1911]